MKVLIVEDEKLAADSLEIQLRNIDPGIQVMDKISTVREAIAWLKKNQAELILLDIHLSDGSSFNIFDSVEVTTPIIFTTAYDQYAIKAFKVNSIDYLLKPIDRKELSGAIKKYKELKKKAVNLDALLETLQTGISFKKRFMVSSGQKLKSIKTEDIAYFFVMEKNVFLCSSEGLNYDIELSLDKIESMLDPDEFFRISRRYIISMGSIKNMYTLSRSRIKVELSPPASEETLVSFHRASAFRKWLNA